MNGMQIDRALKSCKIPNYLGVYSSDRLPHAPGILVANTDDSTKAGQHWLAIYVSDDRRHAEIMDPLGTRPDVRFTRYMNENSLRWSYNSKQLQSAAASTCGHYCILYAIYRGRKNKNLFSFAHMFTRDTGLNDYAVKKALKYIL